MILQKDVCNLSDSFNEFKQDIKGDMKDLKLMIEKSNDSTNKSFQKLSDILQEFQILVAKNYLEKEDLNLYKKDQKEEIEKIDQKIDDHIKEDKENRWRFWGIVIGVPSFIVGLIEVLKIFVS